jgi:hypothetical protein
MRVWSSGCGRRQRRRHQHQRAGAAGVGQGMGWGGVQRAGGGSRYTGARAMRRQQRALAACADQARGRRRTLRRQGGKLVGVRCACMHAMLPATPAAALALSAEEVWRTVMFAVPTSPEVVNFTPSLVAAMITARERASDHSGAQLSARGAAAPGRCWACSRLPRPSRRAARGSGHRGRPWWPAQQSQDTHLCPRCWPGPCRYAGTRCWAW